MPLRLAALVAALALLPIGMLGWLASQGAGPLWPHLVRYVLPGAALETLLLLAGVALVVVPTGVGCAWLVTMREFPGRRALQWALLLPLAVPTYISAYAWLDVLHPVGSLGQMLGRDAARWLPEPRNLPGCALLMGCVLYPYVYLNVRAAFQAQSAELMAVGRTMGGTEWQLFRHVALPLARPAIAVGLSLALLDALNDIGAAEYLGVQTLTVAVSTTWVTRSSAPGAAQIALLLLALAASLVWLEQAGRQRADRHGMEEFGEPGRPLPLSSAGQLGAVLACALPVLLGFGVPTLHLVLAAADRVRRFGLPEGLGGWLLNSMWFAGLATALALLLGLLLAYTARTGGAAGRRLLRLGSLGYAVPGTVMGLGLLFLLGRLDNLLDGAARAWLGFGVGLIFSASGAALVYAYAARFLAIPAGGLQAGYGRIPVSLDEATRLGGGREWQLVRYVHLPLLAPALGAVALLTFVDAMKELPATLLLRPLNVETLATFVHGEAARGTYEEGAVAALLIVLAGLLPMLALGRLAARLGGPP